MITRLRLDAALYDPAPLREKDKKAASRKKDERQLPLSQRLDNPDTAWEQVTLCWIVESIEDQDRA